MAVLCEFIRAYPRSYTAACCSVIGASNDAVVRARRIIAGKDDGEHGLVRYRRDHRPRNVDIELEQLIFTFLDGATAGNPMSQTRRVHIVACADVSNVQGLWRFFDREIRPVSKSLFMSHLTRWKTKRNVTNFDRVRCDHNVCPTCKYFTFRVDALTVQIRHARAREGMDGGLGGAMLPSIPTATMDGSSVVELERALNTVLQQKKDHWRASGARRKLIAWWVEQAKFAAHVVAEKTSVYGGRYDQNFERSPKRNSNGGIVVVHCDGEAGRKIPKQRFETTGGGFEGRSVKNVAFHSMVTQTTSNYFLPQFYPRENTSVLMNLILMEMMRTRGEEVFVMVFDTCAVNYSASLWLLAPHVVDDLKWFKAVVFLFYLPRHGKGAADKIFGGHKALHATADVFCEDHLAAVYEERWESERVILCEASSFVDYKEYLLKRSNGRDGRELNIREKAYAEVIAVREEMMTQSKCDDVVLDHLRPFVSKPGHYRMRGSTPDDDIELEIDDFCAWPSVAASDFGEAPLPMLLRDVVVDDADPLTGVSANPEKIAYPVSRSGLLMNGYNNSLIGSIQVDIPNVEAKYSSPLVPPSFSPTKLVARARNFAFRRHSLGERQPQDGLYEPLEELNTRLGRKMFDARDVTFVPISPRDEAHLVAPLDSSHADYDRLLEFSAEVKDDPSRHVTTADLVQALTPSFDYNGPAPLCDLETSVEVMQTQKGTVRSRAFRRMPKGSERDPVEAFGAACRMVLGDLRNRDGIHSN